MRTRNQRGFTLMELMVVIVIVAILAAVAVPLYINYVNDAKRSEAKGAIAAIISAQQVYYQKTCPACTYAANAEDVKVFNDPTNPEDIVGEAARNWTFAITSADASGFVITATGQAGGDAEGLFVQCTYTRAAGATWDENAPASPPPPGS
jgi:prepilin-type N-terminal cleavage/methylation domain-containing protein